MPPWLQAQKLEEMLSSKGQTIDRVLDFEVPDQLLVDRITGRWVHPASGRSYHERFAPPKVAGVDDVTGEPLVKRKDDNAETLKSRLSAFHAQTAPVSGRLAGGGAGGSLKRGAQSLMLDSVQGYCGFCGEWLAQRLRGCHWGHPGPCTATTGPGNCPCSSATLHTPLKLSHPSSPLPRLLQACRHGDLPRLGPGYAACWCWRSQH